jgi:hypothetical protein
MDLGPSLPLPLGRGPCTADSSPENDPDELDNIGAVCYTNPHPGLSLSGLSILQPS